MKFVFTIFFLLLADGAFSLDCTGGRYLVPVFSSVQVDSNLLYGEAL